jgi:putative heme-binding domain-containing protein
MEGFFPALRFHRRYSRSSRLVLIATALVVAVAFPSAQLLQDQHGQYTQAEIDAGARVYSSQCATCHGPNGDRVSGVDLRRGQFRRAVTDEDLVRIVVNGVPGAGMPPFTLQPAELTGVVAFIRAGLDSRTPSIKIGTAARGKGIVEGKGGCLTCHRIGGSGSRVAPDLTDIGVARGVDMLHRSLTDPTAGMLPINRPVRITMKDGRTVNGRRLNEDTFTVQVIDDKEQLHSIAKSDIRSLVVETKSPMPSFAGKLTGDELSDVIAYLVTLRGQP